MIKHNLFECNVGDKVIYTRTFVQGEIAKFYIDWTGRKYKLVIHWNYKDPDQEHDQTISLDGYNTYPDWRKVVSYETEQDLMIINLKYTPEKDDDDD